MGLFDKIDRSAVVTGRMADTLGVDFADAIVQNPDSVRDYRQAVMRCTACDQEDKCIGWMETHPHAAQTPDYCRNKDILERLAQG